MVFHYNHVSDCSQSWDAGPVLKGALVKCLVGGVCEVHTLSLCEIGYEEGGIRKMFNYILLSKSCLLCQKLELH